MTAAPQGANSASTQYDLGEIVRQLSNLRTNSQKSRYRDATPAMPSRVALQDIADGLVAALFPRHFGPAGLAQDGIDDFVSETLSTVLSSLRDQVHLELTLAKEWEGSFYAVDPERGPAIVAEFARNLPSIRAALETDVRAGYDGDPSAKSVDEVIFCFPSVAAISRYRIAHRLHTLGVPLLARIICGIAHSRTGIDIHPGARIGPGFFIDHGTGVVIGETAIVGRNVRLYQAVTLGARAFETDENGALLKNYPRHPIVEDNVVIYAGATILGRVTIGQGAIIGGNVWLTNSVPAGSHITQAKVLKTSFGIGEGI